MHILFVCTGNTCRSPLAESIARAMVAERARDDVQVSSAGTNAWDGASASDGSILVALEHGLDLSTHRARSVTSELVAAADLVLTMSPSHLERVEALGGEGKTHLLTTFAAGGARLEGGQPIHDPFGGDLITYRETFEELEDVLRRVVDRLAQPPAMS
jgi:protein-tyrosine-phosphatase